MASPIVASKDLSETDGASVATETPIAFDDDTFKHDEADSRVFDYNEFKERNFQWTNAEGIALDTLKLFRVPINVDSPLETWTYESGSGSDVIQAFDNKEGVTMNFGPFNDDERTRLQFNDILALQILWKNDEGKSGISYSSYFALTNIPDDEDEQRDEVANDLDKSITSSFGPQATAGAQNLDPNNPNASTIPLTTATTDENKQSLAPSSGSSDAGQVTGTDPASLETSESDDSSSGGGSNGLAKGAIAGIVVGGVVFLALISLLAFFLLRRRARKGKPQGLRSGGYSDPQHTSNAYIVDKVDPAIVAQDPNSPYSDDGHQNGMGAARGLPVTQHTPLNESSPHHGHRRDVSEEHDGFAPYQDTRGQHNYRGGAGSEASNSPTSSQQQGVSRHLVEEGMTQDEIRRLEEEERQLDAEIERAGRR